MRIDKDEMTKFDRWFLKRLCRKIVKQGRHSQRITEYYRIIMEAARKEFTEDTSPSLNSFMLECFEEAQKVKIKKED